MECVLCKLYNRDHSIDDDDYSEDEAGNILCSYHTEYSPGEILYKVLNKTIDHTVEDE